MFELASALNRFGLGARGSETITDPRGWLKAQLSRFEPLPSALVGLPTRSEIAAQLAEKAMFDLVAPVERVTGYDTHIPLFRLEMKYLPSVEKIIAATRRTLAAG